jgi:hypothetical protein
MITLLPAVGTVPPTQVVGEFQLPPVPVEVIVVCAFVLIIIAIKTVRIIIIFLILLSSVFIVLIPHF